MSEDSDKKSNLVEDVIKSRLKHPFIGTLIVSSLLTNYDLILTLIGNYGKYPIELNISEFQFGLWESPFYYRIWLPLFFMLFIPLALEPLGNYLYRTILAFSERKTNDKINEENNKLVQRKLNNTELLYSNLNSEFHQLSEVLSMLMAEVLPGYKKELPSIQYKASDYPEKIYLFQSKDNLEAGELVSLVTDMNHIEHYNTYDICVGIVIKQVFNGYYLVLGNLGENLLLHSIGTENENDFYYDRKSKGIYVAEKASDKFLKFGNVINGKMERSHRTLGEDFYSEYIRNIYKFLRPLKD